MLSVGEILKKHREKLGIKLSEVEKQIRIREKFLRAIEENDWNIFTSKIYISGIIKNYSQYLGLDP
ncbi:helix-turn-helix domain-containing protein, partial [Candidatus Roizmanbacteria bacterium]|nr:helix-turn-helix domain-containing protein [Candidatus Roizmanbacteria bacterium]